MIACDFYTVRPRAAGVITPYVLVEQGLRSIGRGIHI